MDLLPDDEQAQIARAARTLLADQFPIGKVHRTSGTGGVVDDGLWKTCAVQGWFGLGLAEEHGGAGYGLAEETLLFRELGRHLVPGPFIGTVLAAHLAALAGATDTTDRLLAGELIAALAVPITTDTVVRESVRGTFTTFDGADGTVLLVLGETDTALVPAAAARVEPKSCFDHTARLAHLTIDAQGTVTAPKSQWDGTAHATVLISAMLSGIAEATRDASVEYAQVRKQFGAPIGAFQAVKHRCADAAVRADAATHLTSLAALSSETHQPDAELLVASALRVSTDAAFRNAADNIQNHGGIGFTAEAEPHLFLKRTHVLAATLGDDLTQRQALLSPVPAG